MNDGTTSRVSPEALLRIFDCAPVMINVIDADGRITLVNREWECTLGCHVNEAQALARELLGCVRNLSLDLRPPPLDDLGLHAALLWHFDRYTSPTGVQVGFTRSGLAGQRLGRDVEIAVYRIIQEALTNVARHAGATEVSVHVAIDHNVLQRVLGVEIEDRGRGFDPEAALTSVSSGGLLGMRERVKLLNGAFEVKSAPGAGARVTAEFRLVDSPSGTRA